MSPAELGERYHAVIYAYGAETDRHLGIPARTCPGSGPATAFVGWYNAHPDYADLEFDLSCERAVVIGNGNVAADVTRMLALTRDELEADRHRRPRDRRPRRLRVREIVVLGRRGPRRRRSPTQSCASSARWPTPTSWSTPRELELDDISRAYLDPTTPTSRRARTSRILTEFSGAGRRASQADRAALPRSPGRDPGRRPGRALVVGRNELYRDDTGAIRARDTGEREEDRLRARAALDRLQGHRDRGHPVRRPPRRDPQRGRARDRPRGRRAHPGQYVVGWIKRGPSGVIGTNKKDAQETVERLFEDVETANGPRDRARRPGGDRGAAGRRRPGPHVTYLAGRRSTPPRGRGEPLGRPRVKFCRIDEMVEVASR